MNDDNVFRTETVTCESTCSLREAARRMRDHHVGDVIVVDDERAERRRPVGLVTDRDLVVSVLAEGLDPEKLTVGDVMTDRLRCVEEHASTAEIVFSMGNAGVRRLPVVDGEGYLIGIVSADDLMELVGLEMAALGRIACRERENEAARRPPHLKSRAS